MSAPSTPPKSKHQQKRERREAEEKKRQALEQHVDPRTRLRGKLQQLKESRQTRENTSQKVEPVREKKESYDVMTKIMEVQKDVGEGLEFLDFYTKHKTFALDFPPLFNKVCRNVLPLEEIHALAKMLEIREKVIAGEMDYEEASVQISAMGAQRYNPGLLKREYRKKGV